jgi:2',3'-cyclic-nucleotide 2'-phosphodiesterase (5'-nucleotidase family)
MKTTRLFLLSVVSFFLFATASAQANLPKIESQDIVILYDNDVHCAIDGYAKMAGERDHILETTSNVCVVSSGDFMSGRALGSVSRGEYIIDVMNAVHYDYVTIGNHEFDFGIPQMTRLFGELNSKVVCCNLWKIENISSSNEAFCVPMYDSYEIRNFGGKKVAFIGIATPATISTSTPSYFKDDQQRFVYTFGKENSPYAPHYLVDEVQKQVNAARHEGADYVVALAHLGIDPPAITSTELIAQTTGIDVVLDGHSHSVIEERTLNNKDGHPVILTSTGTAFAHIGILVIREDGTLETRLLPCADIPYTNPKVQQKIDEIYKEYEMVGSRKIGYSEANLTINYPNGKRLVRTGECSLGDFVADAMLAVTGAEIAWMNSGGCRSNIPAGTITFNSIFTACPFDNQVYLCKIPGQDLLDALEMAVSYLPTEGGVFPQVAGFRFEIDPSVPSPAEMNPNTQIFELKKGPRRIKNVEIFHPKKGKYVKLSPKKQYTIAGTSFSMVDNGDGLQFPHLTIVKKDFGTTREVIEKYITEYLNGKIGKEREETAGRIQIINQH